MTSNMITSSHERIHSIDSLRGITLLGILIVHTVGLFGFFAYRDNFSDFGKILANGISILLSNRCAPIFGMLFGVSFYLILRKPSYSGRKFLWRCVLLLGMGLINKLFYTYDALMWYGILGMVLLLFRYASPKVLIGSAIGLRLFAVFLAQYHIGDLLFPPEENNALKYVIVGSDLLDTVFAYPLWESVKDYLRIVLNGGVFTTFTYFLFGYWVARKGYVSDLGKYSKMIHVCLFGISYLLLYVGYYFTKLPLLLSFGNWCGALFMATLFLYFYYKTPAWLGFLEYYGKLGLTNYTLQSLFGVLFMAWVAIPYGMDMLSILCCSMLFYALQCSFSRWWLSRFTNGPLEWLWRCLTNGEFVSPVRIKP